MIVHTFRYVTSMDFFDDSYPHWSRKYEYPTVLQEMNTLAHCNDIQVPMIHNTSWGFDVEHHQAFKNKLESRYGKQMIFNSDLLASHIDNTEVYDITQPAPEAFVNAFDFVLNISAVEEIAADHSTCLQNLYDQVRPGGFLICTFDYPGIQFPLNFGGRTLKSEDYLGGLSNTTYRIYTDASVWGGAKNLSVLLMVVQKEKGDVE